MRYGGNLAKATLGAGATVGGAILGGKRFVDTKKSTRSFSKGFGTMSNPVSKPYINKNAEPSKLAKYGGIPTRIATMPLGMIKDLTQGGVVGMGKNFIPRVKNIATGDSFVNHAQGKSILNKEPLNANNTEEHKG